MNNQQNSGDQKITKAKLDAWLKNQVFTQNPDYSIHCKFSYRSHVKEMDLNREVIDDITSMMNIYSSMIYEFHEKKKKAEIAEFACTKLTNCMRERIDARAQFMRSEIDKNMESIVNHIEKSNFPYWALDKQFTSNIQAPERQLQLENKQRTQPQQLQLENKQLTQPQQLQLEYHQQTQPQQAQHEPAFVNVAYKPSDVELKTVFRLDDEIMEKIMSETCSGIELLEKIAGRKIHPNDLEAIRVFCGNHQDYSELCLEGIYVDGLPVLSPLNIPQKMIFSSSDFFLFYYFDSEKKSTFQYNPYPHDRFTIIANSIDDAFAIIAVRALFIDYVLHFYSSFF